MLNAKNLVIAGLSVLVIDSVRVGYKNRKKFARMQAENNTFAELINLYAKKLNESDIHPDEFECIIMNDLIK